MKITWCASEKVILEKWAETCKLSGSGKIGKEQKVYGTLEEGIMAQQSLYCSHRETKAGPPTGKLEGLICSIHAKSFIRKQRRTWTKKKGLICLFCLYNRSPFNLTSQTMVSTAHLWWSQGRWCLIHDICVVCFDVMLDERTGAGLVSLTDINFPCQQMTGHFC